MRLKDVGPDETAHENERAVNPVHRPPSPLIIPDQVEDELGVLLRRLNDIPSWTKEKHQAFEEIRRLAKKRKYKFFKGHCRTYHLQRKGDHGLFDVPPNKRGALAEFRGKRVRLVCGGAWDQYSDRWYFAGPIREDRNRLGKGC